MCYFIIIYNIVKGIKVFLEKKKTKSNKMVENDVRIPGKMKNKDQTIN